MALCDDGSNDTIFAMKEIERRKSERLHAIGGTPIIALRVTFRPITQTMGGTVHFDGKAGRTTEEIKGVGTERALSSEP